TNVPLATDQPVHRRRTFRAANPAPAARAPGYHRDMTLDEYQARARTTALYPEHARVLYPALKLAGEAGEVTEKLGKLMRDEGYRAGDHRGEAQKAALAKELGDVLWHVATLAAGLGLTRAAARE